MRESKSTASEEKRRKEKCRSCGLTEQEMDAALLLMQLSGDSSVVSVSISSSSVSYHEETTAVKRYNSSRSEREEEKEKENDSTRTGVSSNRAVIEINNNPFKSTTKVRKFRSLVDLYQSTTPLTNNNLHGKRIAAHQSSLLLYDNDYETEEEEEEEKRSSDLISDAGSAIMERRDDDDDDEMETTTEHELIRISSSCGTEEEEEEEEKREDHKSPVLAMATGFRRNPQNNPHVMKRKFLDFSH